MVSLNHRFIASLVHWFTGALVDWSVDSLVHWLVDSSGHCFTASLFHWLTKALIHCFIGSSIHWFIDSFIHSVVHGFFHVMSAASQPLFPHSSPSFSAPAHAGQYLVYKYMQVHRVWILYTKTNLMHIHRVYIYIRMLVYNTYIHTLICEFRKMYIHIHILRNMHLVP